MAPLNKQQLPMSSFKLRLSSFLYTAPHLLSFQWKDFGVFTFPDEIRQNLSAEAKMQLWQKFIQALVRKNKDPSFFYFWCLEDANQGEANIHFNLLLSSDYSQLYLRHRWNKTLNLKESLQSTDVSPIRSLHLVIPYCLKEEKERWGFSLKLKSLWMHFYRYIQSEASLKSFSLGKGFLYQPPKTASKEDELAIERGFFSHYNASLESPDLLFYLHHLSLALQPKKASFLSSLKQTYLNKTLHSYLRAPFFFQPSSWDLLWESLLYFLSIPLLHGHKIKHSTFVQRLSNVLLSLIKPSPYFLTEGPRYHLALTFLSHIKLYMSDCFDISQHTLALEDGGAETYISVKLLLSFPELASSLQRQGLHVEGFKPLLLPPKDWILRSSSQSFTEEEKQVPAFFVDSLYHAGGYHFNGILFKRDLCQPHAGGENRFRYLRQEALDSINALQRQPLQVNRVLLDYVQCHKEIIYAHFFPRAAQLPGLLGEVQELLRGSDSGQQSLLLQQRTTILQEISLLELFETNLSMATFYSSYENFYYSYEVDFRGRIYALSSALNFQKDDFARSLVHSQESSPLSYYWFSLFCVRKYGVPCHVNTAVSMHSFFELTIEPLMRTFRHSQCWMKAEDPWAFLACCLEYERYLLFPSSYHSSLILYFDTSCSGPQLISLLLGMETYASALNLAPKEEKDARGDFCLLIIEDFCSFLQRLASSSISCDSVAAEELLIKVPRECWNKLLKPIILTLNYSLVPRGILAKLSAKNKQLQLHLSSSSLIFLRDQFFLYVSQLPMFKALEQLSALVEEVSSLNKPVLWYSSPQGFTLKRESAHWYCHHGYNVYLKKTVRVRKLFKTRRRLRREPQEERVTAQLSFSRKVFSRIDAQKQSLSFRANIIHHIDALWIHSFLQAFYRASPLSSILPIHDRFGVTMKDIDLLNKEVRRALYTLFKDPLGYYRLLHSIEKCKGKKILPHRRRHLRQLSRQYRVRGGLKYTFEDSYYLIFPG